MNPNRKINQIVSNLILFPFLVSETKTLKDHFYLVDHLSKIHKNEVTERIFITKLLFMGKTSC